MKCKECGRDLGKSKDKLCWWCKNAVTEEELKEIIKLVPLPKDK